MNTLFYALEVIAPWDDAKSPRLVPVGGRHLTLEFLGRVKQPERHPTFFTDLGIAGCLSQLLELKNVLAYAFKPLVQNERLLQLKTQCKKEQQQFLPHVTIARKPFDVSIWRDHFVPLPAYTKDVHLYQSRGALVYEPVWTKPMLAPFSEIEHTADMAFHVRGINLRELYANAFLALAFFEPSLIHYFKCPPNLLDIDDIVIALNRVVGEQDARCGVSFKAVSFHGDIKQMDTHLLWEMIVDV